MDVLSVRREDGCHALPAQLRPRARVVQDGPVMGPEGWPLDAASAAALVVRVVEEVEHRSEEESDVLLSDLLCAAWPSCWAQDQ